MLTREIKYFSENRVKARAYFCYLFSHNLPNKLPSVTPTAIIGNLQKIKRDLLVCDGVYLLDEKGVQVSPTFLNNGDELESDIGKIRSNRAYYYRAMHEKRCSITDPYPSLITNALTVTASQPIMDENGEIKYVACLDIPLSEVIRISAPSRLSKASRNFFRFSYASFSLALAMVALLLFVKGIEEFLHNGIYFYNIEIKHIFEATILLTLSLAMFDLVKTLFEEEVLGKDKGEENSHDPHKTMVRFLGSIIIALSIEALMLVFKFAMTQPDKILNAVYIIAGVSLLLVSLGTYIKLTSKKRH